MFAWGMPVFAASSSTASAPEPCARSNHVITRADLVWNVALSERQLKLLAAILSEAEISARMDGSNTADDIAVLAAEIQRQTGKVR
jgi:hypothetical protein